MTTPARIQFKAGPDYAHKTFAGAQIKELTEEGDITVAFAQLDVVDRDQDLTVAGAIPSKSVAMSAYGHTSWLGELPTGRGDTREESGWGIFAGKFFMDTDQGRNAHATVKAMADLQEWSYGYLPLDYAFEQRDGQQIRVLKKLDIFEVSPVLVGAGIGTHTRGIKAGPGAGLPYAEHLSLGLATVEAIVARSKDRAEFRAKEGRVLSSTNRERLASLATALGEAVSTLQALLEETDPDQGKSLAAAAQQIEIALEQARFLGVTV